MFVANFHFLCGLCPVLIYGTAKQSLSISDTPLAIIFNGHFAVSIFFVLSGFVISNSADKRHLAVSLNIGLRYLRLAGPVLASTLLAWLLLKLMPGNPHKVMAINHSPWMLLSYDAQIPPLLSAFDSGVFGAFTNKINQFNNVLWTMQIELLGSWAIYLIYGFERREDRYILLLLLMLVAAAFTLVEYSSFAVGAVLRELVAAKRLPRALPWPALVLGVCLGSMMPLWDLRVLDGVLNLQIPAVMLHHAPLRFGQPCKLWHVVGAGLIIYAAINLPSLQTILSSTICRFFGRISFGFYLVHAPILYTLISSFYLLHPQNPRAWLPLCYVVFMVIALPAGYLFTRMADEPIVRLIRHLQRSAKSPEAATIGQSRLVA